MSTDTMQRRTTLEQSPGVIAALVLAGVLTVAPLYLFAGSVDSYYLGVPAWGWLGVVVYYVILGLVVYATRSLEIVGTAEEVTEE